MPGPLRQKNSPRQHYGKIKSQCDFRCGCIVAAVLIISISVFCFVAMVILHFLINSSPQTHQGNNVNSCMVVDEMTGYGNGIENQLWYFREDFFLNSHHYFWHTYTIDYPLTAKYIPNRAGELFFFMHHELLARYLNERLTTKEELPEVEALQIHKGLRIPQGYVSYLTLKTCGTQPVARLNNRPLIDINAPDEILVSRTENTHWLLLNAISETGHIPISNGSNISIAGWEGANILGEVLYQIGNYPIDGLASEYTTSGLGYHAQLHGLTGFIMAPEGGNSTASPGVLLPPSTSLRDPLFYSIHMEVEHILREHKNTLKPYSSNTSDFPLLWPSVSAVDLKVVSAASHISKTGRLKNELYTYWGSRNFNPPFGLDWNKTISSSLQICPKHLDHAEFTYIINYETTFEQDTNGTVRIFLAPRYYRNGSRLGIGDEFQHFFSLDRFTTLLKAGRGQIIRSSKESALTSPPETWLGIKDKNFNPKYCGCGLPHHLLLPKGTKSGKTHDLFVMLTTSERSKVQEPKGENMECENAPIWCPNRGDRKYHDTYPMGYPFDRRPMDVYKNVEEWVGDYTNMKTIQVTINHLEETL